MKIADHMKKQNIRNRTGTRGYMPLEAILSAAQQTTKVDIWACGVIMLSLLARRHPIFSLNNSSKIQNFTISNLVPILCVFGAKDVRDRLFQLGYGMYLPEEMKFEETSFEAICANNTHLQKDTSGECMEVLKHMLTLGENERWSAE